jgi:hypothetical protein
MRLQVRAVPATITGDAADTIRGREWADVKEAFADRVVAQLEEHAPDARDATLARHVMSPEDFERENPNLIGGDCVSGSHHLDQNYLRRPSRLTRYRTRWSACSWWAPRPGRAAASMPHGLPALKAVAACRKKFVSARLKADGDSIIVDLLAPGIQTCWSLLPRRRSGRLEKDRPQMPARVVIFEAWHRAWHEVEFRCPFTHYRADDSDIMSIMRSRASLVGSMGGRHRPPVASIAQPVAPALRAIEHLHGESAKVILSFCRRRSSMSDSRPASPGRNRPRLPGIFQRVARGNGGGHCHPKNHCQPDLDAIEQRGKVERLIAWRISAGSITHRDRAGNR